MNRFSHNLIAIAIAASLPASAIAAPPAERGNPPVPQASDHVVLSRYGGREVAERVVLQHANAAAIEITILSQGAALDRHAFSRNAVATPSKVGKFTQFATWEGTGFVFNVVNADEGIVYRTPINFGDSMGELSELLGESLTNPLTMTAAQYEDQLPTGQLAASALAVPAGFGTPIGTWNVTAYSNGADHSYVSPYKDRWGYQYQCVHLAVKFADVAQYRDIRGPGGNAESYWRDAKGHGLVPYANSGTMAPRPGDFAVSTYNIHGHIAIIKSVKLPTSTSTGYVVVFSENWASTWGPSDGFRTITLSYLPPLAPSKLPRYKMAGFSSAYSIAGWVR